MVVGWKQITLGEHRGPRKTRQDSSSLGNAARRLTLSRYVARLKPRCGSLALSEMWHVLTALKVCDMVRFERNPKATRWRPALSPVRMHAAGAALSLTTHCDKAADGRRLGLLHCHSHRAEPARLKEALTPASLSCAQIEA